MPVSPTQPARQCSPRMPYMSSYPVQKQTGRYGSCPRCLSSTSLTITSSSSRMQKAVPANSSRSTTICLCFTAHAVARLSVYTDPSPITCFGWVLLVEGGCSILRSCSCAHMAFSVVFMPNSFCHTSITMSKNEASLFSSQLW